MRFTVGDRRHSADCPVFKISFKERPTLPRKVIIDADPGIADAVAIAFAMLEPELDILAVTATAGAVDARDATRNVKAIVEAVDPAKRPRLGRCTDDEERCQRVPCQTTAQLNGTRGLGERRVEVPELHHQQESSRLLLEMVREHPHEITLLTLGPLTNLQFAHERAPDFLDQLQSIVMLGGAVHGNGDVTAAAEFNIFGNPEAARLVLRHPCSKLLVPLDTSLRPVLTFDRFQRLSWSPTPLSQMLQELLSFSLRQHHHVMGVEGIAMQTLTALSAVSRPRLVDTATMVVDVETTGELTRGMTVFDRRPGSAIHDNVAVVTEVDSTGVLEYFGQCVHRCH